jgi:hypothetical protein
MKFNFKNKKISLLILFFCVFFNSQNVFSVETNERASKSQKNQINFIKQISSFSEVDFDKIILNKDTLVLFDVDHTLLKPIEIHDQYYLSSEKKCDEKMGEMRSLYADKIDQNFLVGSMMSKMKAEIIEPDVVKKIEFLKKNQIPCIAITAIPSGFNAGLNDTWQNWRFSNLKNRGIEFSFSDLAFVLNMKGYRRPIFFNGIILADNDSKGNVLKFFLEKINNLQSLEKKYIIGDKKDEDIKKYQNFSLNPKKIIMFDDHDAFLVDLSKICSDMGIEFNGYYYRPYEIENWSEEDELRFHKKIENIINLN